MYHVLLVEPDDHLCAALRLAIPRAGGRITAVGTAADANTVLTGRDSGDQIIVQALLPDGIGLLLADEVRRTGKPALVLWHGRIVVYDGEGTVFLGDRNGVAVFLTAALRENSKADRALVESASIDTGQHAGGRRGR